MAIRNVLVLFGGVSTEYLISLRSAYNIIGGLRRAGFTVLCTGITRSGDWLAYDGPDEAILDDSWEALAREQAVTRAGGPVRSPYEFVTQFHEKIPDVIFPAVHGINCEDGSLQGLLELTGIPYVGCGVLASASGMDKLRAKTLFKAARLPQCRYLAVSRTDVSRDPRRVAEKVAGRIGFPCFLKPNNGGSSVGTMRADDLDSLIRGLTLVSQYDREIIVEEFLTAREIEVAVIGNERPRTAVIGEVRPSADVAYYDYEAKYFKADGAAILLPADLPPEMEKRCAAWRSRPTALWAVRAWPGSIFS
jgi:D-alanine-D-alanine ligase